MVKKADDIPKKKKARKITGTHEIDIDKVILITVDMNKDKESLKTLILKNKTIYSPGDKLTKSNLKRDIKRNFKKLVKIYGK